MGTSLRLGLRLAAAHHPLCDRYREDRAGRWCLGCAVAFPAFLVGALAGSALLLHGLGSMPTAAGALVLGLPQAASYVHRPSRLARAATKATGGAGLGLLVVSWAAAPYPWPWRVAGFVLLGLAALAGQALRMRSIVHRCRACPWRMDWDACPGFRPEGGWSEPATRPA